MKKNEIESEIEIILKFSEKNIAEKIFKAISPDNKPLPKGLKINSCIDNNKIFFYIECKRGLSSLLFTINDIFEMISLSEKTLKITKNK
ncbi:MAG: KEOPS complex subunit Pcc1 [Nitrososphaerota archaeon]